MPVKLPKGSQSALKTARPGRGEHPLPDQGSLHGSWPLLRVPAGGPARSTPTLFSHMPRARRLAGNPNSAKHSCHPWTRELAALNGGRAVNRVPMSPLKSIPSTPEVCLSSCPRILKVPSKLPDQGEGSIPSLNKDPCTDPRPLLRVPAGGPARSTPTLFSHTPRARGLVGDPNSAKH